MSRASETTPLQQPSEKTHPINFSGHLLWDCMKTSAEAGAMPVGVVGAIPGAIAGGFFGLACAIGCCVDDPKTVPGFAAGGACITGVPAAVGGGLVGATLLTLPVTIIALKTREQYPDAETIIQEKLSRLSNELVDKLIAYVSDQESKRPFFSYHSFSSSQLVRKFQEQKRSIENKRDLLKEYMNDYASNNGKKTFNLILAKMRDMEIAAAPSAAPRQ